MYTVGNVYVIAAVAVVGGMFSMLEALFPTSNVPSFYSVSMSSEQAIPETLSQLPPPPISGNTDFDLTGALFGFDISSMSAIISTEPYLCYFNQGPLYKATDGKCSGPTASVQGKSISTNSLPNQYADTI
jgi:hypothetical protein